MENCHYKNVFTGNPVSAIQITSENIQSGKLAEFYKQHSIPQQAQQAQQAQHKIGNWLIVSLPTMYTLRLSDKDFQRYYVADTPRQTLDEPYSPAKLKQFINS